MSAIEKRAVATLASLVGLRMLGLFLILPVFALYAEHLPGATPTLAGLAIGIYGLTQALLQIPFGLWSDRIGRRPVILGGLAIFAAGSVLAALADSIWPVIAGRALQGAGAVSAAVMALAADVTREEHRTKAMASIGMSIGAAFALALLLGPLLGGSIGVPGLFWLTAALVLLGMVAFELGLPHHVKRHVHRDAEPVPALMRAALANPELLRLNAGALLLHFAITATFVTLPLVLRDVAGLASAQHWQLYLPAFVVGALAMVPAIIHAERRARMKPVFLAGIGLMVAAQLGLATLAQGLVSLGLWLLLFFAALNLLEALLPSLVSKIAPPAAKGTAMGLYATCQFMGVFLGGALGGWLHGHQGTTAVFAGAALATALWLLVAGGMRPPRHVSTQVVAVGPMDPAQAALLEQRLLALPGVVEASVDGEEGAALLKVEPARFDPVQLDEFRVTAA
jgi:predicted MFS family arabinose efflux permease